LEDADGIVRRALIYESAIFNNDRGLVDFKLLSFPMAVAQIALNPSRVPSSPIVVPGTFDSQGAFLKFSNTKLRPLGPNDPLYIYGDTGGFQILRDYRQAGQIDGVEPIKCIYCRDISASNFDPDDVNGKIVLIGNVSQAGQDFFSSPNYRHDFGVDLHSQSSRCVRR
jgi:CHASE2 domain-containing sensor protein